MNRLLHKLGAPDLRSIRSNGTLNLVAASALGALVAFVSSLLMAKVMGPTGRGLVALSLQLSYLLAPLFALGLNVFLLRGATGDVLHARQLLQIPVLMGWAVTVSLVAISGLLDQFESYLSWFVVLAGPVAISLSSLAVIRAHFVGNRSIAPFTGVALAVNLFSLLAFLYLWVIQASDAGSWAIVYAVPSLPFTVYALSCRWRIKPLLKLVRSSSTVLTHSIFSLISTRLERVLLPFLVGPGALGLYVVVATTIEAVLWLVRAKAEWLVHSFARQGYSHVGLAYVCRKTWWLLPIILGAAVITVFVVIPWLGPDYAPAAVLVWPVAISTYVFGLTTYLQSGLIASAKPGSVSKIALLMAAISVAVYPSAILIWGVQGAAWGSVCVYSIGLVVNSLVLKKLLRGEMGVGVENERH